MDFSGTRFQPPGISSVAGRISPLIFKQPTKPVVGKILLSGGINLFYPALLGW